MANPDKSEIDKIINESIDPKELLKHNDAVKRDFTVEEIAQIKSTNRPSEPINMSIGDADFMLPYWKEHREAKVLARMDELMGYQRNAGLPNLINAISELHTQVGNCQTEGKHIVVAHGIRQALCAAMYAYSQKHDLNHVYADPPNFFLFGDMAWSLGLDFTNAPGGLKTDKMINIITSPSNPMGQKGQGERGDYNIWDECYNWPQYGDVNAWPDMQDVEIFGLAKATGHAGTRIGWAVTSDDETAELMQQYIRLTTGGVSVEAQVRAIMIILHQVDLYKSGQKRKTVFMWGQKVLDERWNKIHHLGLLSPGHRSGIQVVNASGMFAWCKLDHKDVESNGADGRKAFEIVQEEFNVLGVDGELCYPSIIDSDDEGHVRQEHRANDMFRLNIGCSEETFMRFIDLMRPLSDETQCEVPGKVEE